MSALIQARPEGLLGLNEALGRMAALGQSPRPIWDAVGQYGENSTRLRFKKQADPEGRRWKPSLRALATGGQTLMKDLHLLRSITHRADNRGAEWGSNRIYAAIQNFGGVIAAKGRALRFQLPGGGWVSVKRVKLPPRAFLGVNAEDVNEILNLAGEVAYDAARNRGQGYSAERGE